MKLMKEKLLNSNLKYLLARMGHRDLLAVTDACYNIPTNVETVDIALSQDVPTIVKTLEVILCEIVVEKVYLACEIKEQAPEILKEYERIFKDIPIEFIPHTPQFDDLVTSAKGAVRTGQYNYHAPNCVIKIGCEY